MIRRNSCPSEAALERAFSEGAGEPVAAHLEGCDACASRWSSLATLRAAARAIPVAPLTARREAAVRDAILARTSKAAPPRRRGRLVAAFATAAIAAAALWLSVAPPPPAPTPAPTAVLAPARVEALGATEFNRFGEPVDEVVRLHSGLVTVEVPEGPPRRFRVVTGDAEVEVRGTVFEVEARGDVLQAVRVLRGRVAVRVGERPVFELSAGERWRRPAPRAAPTAEVPDAAAPAPAPRQRRRRRPSAVAPEPPTPTGAERAWQAGWHALRSGESAKAAVAFDAVIAAGEDGPLSEDASYWKAVALSRSGARAPAVAAFQRFIADHPEGARVGGASAMLGWLLHEGGHRDAARRRFQRALADPAADVRRSAEAGLEAVSAD